MSEEIKKYLKKIGRKGGQKGKRSDMGAGSEGQKKAQEGRRKAKEARLKATIEQEKG